MWTTARCIIGTIGIVQGIRGWRASGSPLYYEEPSSPPVLPKGGDGTIRVYTNADLPAVQEFWPKAVEYNKARGFQSFGSTWEWVAQTTEPGRLYLYEANGEIRGMMWINESGVGGYNIKYLEGTGGGAGTSLFKFAAREAVNRGMNLYLDAVPEAYEFYERFPGYVKDGARYMWSVEALLSILR